MVLVKVDSCPGVWNCPLGGVRIADLETLPSTVTERTFIPRGRVEAARSLRIIDYR